MPHWSISGRVDAPTAALLAEPRDDIVREEQIAPGEFIQAEGPFTHYRRRLRFDSVDGELAGELAGRTVAHQEFEYDLDAPVWRPLLAPAIRHQLRRSPVGRADRPWWSPPDRFDRATTRTLCLLSALMVVAGYVGTVISQTITFAAGEFGASRRDQGILLAAVRIGTLLTFVLLLSADRRGRRTVTLWTAAAGCLFTAAGAATTGMWSLGTTQALARAMSNGLALLIGILAAEAVPARSRAYAASALTLAGGLGSGMVVWILPLADLGEAAWRLIYLVPLAGLGLIWFVGRRLDESARFLRVRDARVATASPIDRRRLIALALTSFLVLFFAAPASQFANEFLRDERGFSATQITLFAVVTTTPVFFGVAVAGRLADTKGRRRVAVPALLFAAGLLVVRYATSGWLMWTSATFGQLIGAMTAPVLGVYHAELFATSSRGRANGLLQLITVLGSSAGLLTVGALLDSTGFGRAFLIAAAAPVLAAVVVAVAYPETAGRRLEDLNPD